jgi:hypothetical protein
MGNIGGFHCRPQDRRLPEAIGNIRRRDGGGYHGRLWR